jgi:1,4-dihydroxy-2-naphthoyl-CoA hydrolase
MSIWFQQPSIEDIANHQRGTMAPGLGIEFVEIGADFLRASMPVSEKTRQPMGIMHGGASVVLAETVGSVAATYVLDPARQSCVGQEINANHIRAMREGLVIATARPHHLGSRSQVWGIEIRDPRERLVCVSRLTMAVLDRPLKMAANT